MQPVSFFASNLWRWKCGLPENEPRQIPGLEQLKKSEWSDQFERLMRNRLVMGGIRYGLLNDPVKAQYNRIDMIKKRLAKYEETGNLEFLVDVANGALLEFEEGKHPNRHFKSTEDVEHAKEIRK